MKADEVTEALLEMHFHAALMNLLRDHFGARFLRLLKPSTQKETFVGFDQGWVRSPSTDLISEIRQYISGASVAAPPLHVGYFLQFKIVEEMQNSSKYIPTGWSTPYYRSEAYLKKNPTTGRSQHDTLLQLAKIPQSEVYYACGMLFDELEIWTDADLDKLRLVDANSAPGGWKKGTRHFIAFQTKLGSPFWCSEPIEGRSLAARAWVQRLAEGSRTMGPEELIAFLEDVVDVARNSPLRDRQERGPIEQRLDVLEELLQVVRLPSCLNLVRLSP